MKCKYKKFLKAAYINYDEDYCGCGSSTFTKPTVTTPIIVITGTTAIIACAVSGATIYYTLDGSTPTSSSTEYTGTITLTLSCTIKAIAVKPGMTDSEVASENYIHYLTAWRLVGNSVVHTDEYLTQWKVSGNSQIQQYLTQWKIEGNSVVDNNAILSCGDLGQDGYYHVKISNGVDVFDIALTEPLRMVSGVADTIEYANGVATLTRNFAKAKWNDLDIRYEISGAVNYARFYTASLKSVLYIPKTLNERVSSCLSSDFIQNSDPISRIDIVDKCMCTYKYGTDVAYIYIRDTSTTSVEDFYEKYGTHEFYYRLATPTTETIQAPQIAVSSTNTYSSATTTPYSSFTYANPLIYSCGDYSDVDGKYHVKISNGVTIYDIPLTEPLRKVNDVTDTIEFSNSTAVVTRNIGSRIMGDYNCYRTLISSVQKYRYTSNVVYNSIKTPADNNKYANILCSIYDTRTANVVYRGSQNGISIEANDAGNMYIYDENYAGENDFEAFKAHIKDVEVIYELATPTTEVIQVSPFPVSPTDTYTSANDTPYSAFEYKKNVEIWSCGEYNATDGKYHIVVLPEGKSPVDIALDEPLRKDDDATDKIEFADGVATVTRNLKEVGMTTFSWRRHNTGVSGTYRFMAMVEDAYSYASTEFLKTINTGGYENVRGNDTYYHQAEERIIGMYEVSANFNYPVFAIYDPNYNQADDLSALLTYLSDKRIIYRLATPTTEVIQVPQIQEADSYTCVISQGGKAASWSSFTTE